MNSNDIRQAWLDYYQKKGFEIISSAPLVHPAFPTAFNMSAGMVQLGPRIRSSRKIAPVRECLVQKCIRYFDIPRVGDQSHLSFFEMAGAFEVIDFEETKTLTNIWQFLTQNLKIDSRKLWATVFNQDQVAGRIISLSAKLKQQVSLLVGNRLLLGRSKTNLWQQGGGAELVDNIRLCGPQIEFFYDLGENKGCGRQDCNPFCDCGRFLEISNTLFIKYGIDYNQKPTLKKLVNTATESVIGLERCALITEGKDDLFQTSGFAPLVSLFGKKEVNENSKIITDHLKSLTFILAEEKILPTKKNRGRIIRTLIRRLLTSCYVQEVNPQKILPLLVDEIIKMYVDFYPGVKSAKSSVLQVVFTHEKVYRKTLKRGRRKIKKYLKKNNIQKIGPKEKDYFWKQWGIPAKILSTF